jgi:PAS domain S-box-containing protein
MSDIKNQNGAEMSAGSPDSGEPERIYSNENLLDKPATESADQKMSQQFFNIIEFLPDATFVIDQDKKIIAWNRACELMTGVKKEAILGQGNYIYAEPFFGDRRPILIDLLDTPAPECEANYKYVKRMGNMIYAESFIPRLRDGRGAHLWGVAAPLFDQEGQRCGAIEVVRDMTEQKQAEERLEASERKYRELVEKANSIILRWNSNGEIIFLNEFGQRFFGYSAEEIIGRHVIGTIVPPTESSGRDLRQLIKQICTDPKSCEHSINENMCSNWRRVWISWTNQVVPDDQGQMAEILSVGTDITVRKAAEEALRQSESTIRSVFRAAPVGIGILKNRVQTIVNKRWCEMLGYPEESLIGKSTRILYESDEEFDRVGRELYTHLAKKDLTSVESRMRCSDGSIREVILTAAPIMRDDISAGVVGIIYDITERKQTEEQIYRLHAELQRHAAELEQRVAERTAELAVARDRAESADRLKSAFLATMSHELRTPLNSIIGFTGIILQELAGPLNAEQHKQLEMVRDSARHLLALINDVLDISKIEAGQLEVSSEPFDLRASIGKVTGIVKPLTEKKNLDLYVDVAPEIGVLVSDQRRVEQILLNLINNAIKFTEQGSVTLTAEVLPNDLYPAHSIIHIAIADTGIGIKQEDLSTLFQPFRQIDTGLSRQHEGTGLGLAICRRLADLLGGEIHAASEWGKGSVFTLTLPVKRSGES